MPRTEPSNNQIHEFNRPPAENLRSKETAGTSEQEPVVRLPQAIPDTMSAGPTFLPPQPIQVFSGRQYEDAQRWLDTFDHYCALINCSEANKISMFYIYTNNSAKDWLEGLDNNQKDTYDRLCSAFELRYITHAQPQWKVVGEMFSLKHSASEHLLDYISKISRMGKSVKAPNEQIINAVINGISGRQRSIILERQPKSLEELQAAASIAANAVAETPDESMKETLEDIRKQISMITLNSLQNPVATIASAESHPNNIRPDPLPNHQRQRDHSHNHYQSRQYDRTPSRDRHPRYNNQPPNHSRTYQSRQYNDRSSSRDRQNTHNSHPNHYQHRDRDDRRITWQDEQQPNHRDDTRQRDTRQAHYPSVRSSREERPDEQLCNACGVPWMSSLNKILFILLAMGALLIGVDATAHKPTIMRTNYGIIFQKTSMLMSDDGHWTYTVEIPMTEMDVRPPINTSCSRKADATGLCTILKSSLNEIHKIKTQTLSHYNKVISNIKSIIPEHSKPHSQRFRRSLLPFIGQLAKSFFGTATIEDVELLAKHINALNKQNRKLATASAQQTEHLASYMTATNRRMDNLMTGIVDNHDALDTLSTQITNNLHSLAEMQSSLMTIMTKQIRISTTLGNEIEELYLGVQHLLMGRLSPLIVSKSLLTNISNTINKQLTEHYPNMHIAKLTLESMYRYTKFLLTRHRNNIYISIKFPLTAIKHPLTVYKVHSFPVPVNNDTRQATQLLSLPAYMAITANNDYIVEFNDQSFSTCVGQNILSCPFKLTLQPVTSKSCLLAIFTNDIKATKELCDFRFLHNVIHPKIEYITDSDVLVYNVSQIAIQCITSQRMLPGCHFCLLKIPCHCAASTTTYHLNPQMTNCQKHTHDITKIHPVNLALVQSFFDENDIGNITADTIFNNPLDINIPKFNIFKHNFSDIISSDQQSHFSLARMAEAAKKDEMVFQNLADPILEQLPEINSWPNTNSYISIAALLIASVTMAAFLSTFLKLRSLTMAFFLLQARVPESMALSVPRFNYVHPSTTTETPFLDNETIINLFDSNRMNIMLGALALMLIIMIIRNVKAHRQQPTLMIEFTNGEQTIAIKVITLPLCLKYMKFTASKFMTEIEVNGYMLRPKLYINWQDFIMSNCLNHDTLMMPPTIPLSILSARKTYTGSILVAVNPYKPLHIYGKNQICQYHGKKLGQLPPHIFSIAEGMYQDLSSSTSNQSCVISGESGAGKTENTKFILEYLCSVTSHTAIWVEQQILEANTILEAFGNAKTVRNDNSSRFGKFIQVCFDGALQIRGCVVQDYLLEQSRITFQSTDERNYHVFYQLVAAANRCPELKSQFFIDSVESYNYLNQSGCFSLDGVDDARLFDSLRLALNVLNIPAEMMDGMFSVLSAILLLGNLKFEEEEDEERCHVVPEDSEIVMTICCLLGLDSNRFMDALLFRQIQVRSMVTCIPFKINESSENRHAMAKALYSRTFAWLVDSMNKSTSPGKSMEKFIGVLDIFGFENFVVNSFEQLCINYTNEKLHKFFNHYVFALEQEIYKEEDIAFEHINFTDNTACLELIEKSPKCVLKFLDEECRFPQGTDTTYITKQHKEFQSHPSYIKGSDRRCWPVQFGICHYAGVVTYSVAGILDKNKDTQQDQLFDLMYSSTSSFVKDLTRFQGEFDLENWCEYDCSPNFLDLLGVRLEGLGGRQTISRTARSKPTVADTFKHQLSGLVDVLALTNPWYVRCLKPNSKKLANDYCEHEVLTQLQYSGMLDIIRIKREGYPVHMPFSQFLNCYGCLLSMRLSDEIDLKDGVQRVLIYLQLPSYDWQIGKTKVFMRTHIYEVLEVQRKIVLSKLAILIQRMWKGYACRRDYQRIRHAVLVLQQYYRVMCERAAYVHKRRAAIIIQAYTRGMFAREVVRTLKLKKRRQEEQELRERQEQLEQERKEKQRLENERQNQEKIENECIERGKISNYEIDVSSLLQDVQPSVYVKTGTNEMTLDDFQITTVDSQAQLTTLTHLLDNLWQEHNVKVSPNCLDLDELFGFLHESESSTAVLTQQYERYEKKQKALDDINAEFTSLQELLDDKGTCLDEGPANMERSNAFATSSDVGEVTGVKRDDGPGTSSEHDSSHLLNSRSLLPSSDDTDLPLPPPPLGDGADIKSGPLNYSIQDDFPLPPPPPLLTSSQLLDSSTEAASSSTNVRNRDSVVLTNVNTLDFVNLSTNRPLPPPVAPKPSVNKLTLDDETILEVLPPVLPPQTSPLEAKLLLGPVPPIPPPLPPLSGVLHSDLGDSVNSEFVYISSVSASTVSNTNLSSPPPPPVPEKVLLLPPPPPLLPDRLSDDCFTGESSRSDNMDTSFLPSPEPPSSYDNLDYNMPIIPPPPLFNGLSSPLESTSSSPLSVPDVGRAISGTVSLARSDSTATTTDKYSSTSSFDKGSSKLPKQSSIGPVEVIVNTGIDSEFSDNVLSCDLYSGAYSMHRQSSVESTSTGANPLSPKSFRMGSQEQDSFKRRQIEKRIQDLEDKRICLMENDGDEVENPADMLEFAENHFHEHVRDFVGSVMIRSLRKRSNQDVLTKEEMLQYNKGGLIPTSHLRLHDIENIHLACTIFKELTRYIKEDLKAELAISTIQFIVRCGIERVELRDEIFIQLVRQSSQNPDPSALKRTWLVFCHCTAIFSPSKAFKKYLVTYIKKNLSDKDVSIYSQVCLKQLKRPKFMSRKMPPSAMEIACLESCTHLICRVYFMDGKTKAISVMPCDTSSDVLERLALKIGLRSVEGWALYEVTTEYEKFIRGYEYLTDILAQWELHKRNFSTLNKYESVSKRRLNSTSVGEEEAKFIFRKRVYRDMDDVPNDPVEYSLLFAEAVQKVVKYDEFSVSREVALQLAGLQTQVLHGDYEPGKESRYKDVEQYLSRRILSHSADWPKELELAHKQFGSGKADMEAKVWYLTCVKQFPLYGCTFFPITHKGLWSHKGSTLLAISMNGIKFVKARDKSVIHEFDYSEIERFNVDSNENYISFELKNDVNTDCPQRSFIFETNQKEDIGCLVASYSASHTTWLKTDTDTYMKGRVTEEDRLRVYDEIVGCRMMLIGGHILQKPPEEGIGFLKSTFRRLTKTKIEKLRRRYSVDQLDTAFNAEYWSYTKVPTRQALTRFSDPVLEDLAVQMFNSCLGTEAGQEFRNEVNAHNQMELAQALAQKCLDSDAICNEFFLQLIKQTTENPDLNSEINCWYWQVIAVIICTCLPSNPVLLSYVQVHLKKCSSDSITVEGKYARFSQKCLSRSLPRKKRKFPPSLHEIQYIMQKQQIKSKIFFLSGEHRIIEFDSASSAEELIKAIKTKIGMRSDADSFALYENMGTIEKLMPADDRVVDAISKWDRWVKGNNVNKELKLVFKKRLFITPYLNASDRIECELVAHQLVEDVFERRIPVSEQDAIQLCALKLQSEQDSKTGELDFRSVMRILPRDIRPGIKEEQIVDAHRKIENYSTQECILAFIDLLKSWLFFGAAVFEVKQAYTSTLPKTLMLLVNETGVHLMDSKLTRVFGSYRHMDIGCTSPSLQSIMLIIGDIAKGSKYIFNTNQSSEIASLIRDYGSELKKRGIIRESNDGTINGSVASSIHTLHSTQNTANGIS